MRHGHVQVNGKRVTIPSYRLRRGDVVTLATKARSFIVVRHNLDTLDRQLPAWIDGGGELIRLPADEQSAMLTALASVGEDLSKPKPELHDGYQIVTEAAQRSR